MSAAGGIRVLHVDDDPAFADMSATILEREHDRISVQTVTSPADGLQQLADDDIDCIVSDYDMPRTNGIEFLDAVREQYPDLPFILYTGKGSEEIASDAISAGVTDYLQKQSGTSQYTVLANRIRNAVDQYRSRRAVKETERKLSELAERTDDVLFMVDEDWSELLFINSAYEEVWGGSIDELEDDPTSFLELVHPADRDDARASMEQVLAGDSSQLEYRIVRPDGEHRWVRGTTQPIRDEDGNRVRIVGQVRDITEEKERELHLETIIGNLPGYVYRHAYDSEYPLKFVKGDAETITGYTATELEEEIVRAEEIIHPDDRADLWADHIQGLEAAGRFDSTYRIITKDGDVRWIHDQGQLIENPVTGEEVIDGFITDVSDRIQRERDLRNQQTFIDESLDVLQDVFYVIDTDGELIRWNERMSAVSGYTDEEIDEMDASEFFVEEHRDRIGESVEEIMETGSSSVRADILTADGERRTFELRATRLTEPYRGETVAVGIGRDISEQVRRERELEQTNALLSTLFETLPVGILVEDTDRNVLAVNEGFFDLFDMPGSSATAVGTDCEQLAHEASELFTDSDGFVARIDELVSERIPTDGEQLSLRDGRVFERSHHPIELPSGESNVWVYRDVTDRKQYEQTIASLHDRADDILRAETDEQVAEVMVEATGELLGMPINGVALHDDSENVLRTTVATDRSMEVVDSLPTFRPGDSLAWEVFEAGETVQYDDVSTEPGRHNSDTSIRSEVIVPLGDHGVAIVGSTEVGKFDETDVSLVETLASHAETALDRIEREQELEVKNQRLDAILDNTTTVMFMKDDDGRYLFVNRKYRELFDLEDEAIVGQTDYDLHAPAVAEEVWENDRAVIENGEPFETEEQVPVDGEERIFLSSKVPIYDTGDRADPAEPVAVFGVASDITELRHREERLQRERDRLDEFASVVSHDLRNPLSIAKTRLEFVREECDSQHLDPIDRALARMDTLIEDLLTLARGGDYVSETEAVDLAELSENCWRNVETVDATLRAPIARTVRADRSRLTQLLENLIRNAVEHGGDDVTVTVGELTDGFYVEDDGSGIPEDDRDAVFDAGYSTAEDGTGFGLSIVNQIAEAHGWEIRATAGADGGARFEITGVTFTE